MANLISVGVLLFIIPVSTVAAEDTPQFKITTKRTSDRVEVKVEKSRTVLNVHSPFGIGHAVVERRGEAWPESVVLRLHLQGLENFKVVTSRRKLEGSVSLQHGKPVVRLWQDDNENSPLDGTSPVWIDVHLFGGDGVPAHELPLKDGYFEMALPKTIFDGNPTSLTVYWIDFYRN